MLEKPLLIELQYLPGIYYFAELIKYSAIQIEYFENYQKQSYRNRCKVLTSNKVVNLTIPIVGGKGPISEIRIDNKSRWSTEHWRTLQTAYGKSPYYEYYVDYFREIYNKNHEFLFDFNMELLTLCLKLLKINVEISLTSQFVDKESIADLMVDMRNEIHPKKSYNTLSLFPVQYQQVFGREFVNDLSIIDLLFCEGPGSLAFLMKSN